MKIEFIKRGAATRLILIFAGWSTDAWYYSDCVFDGWDTAVVSDYRDLTMPPIPTQYSTVYIFAYSLGVFPASRAEIQATVRVAICGSPIPVSDDFGIQEAIFAGTLDGLTERSLMKFHLRMAGDKATYDKIQGNLPVVTDINLLKQELSSIRDETKSSLSAPQMKFERVYIAEEDRIFPYANLLKFWSEHRGTEIVVMKAPHAVDIRLIIKNCLPDTKAIGEGFQRAEMSYKEHAVVQSEICRRIVDKLEAVLPAKDRSVGSLLEIGPGQGLLTDEWSKVLCTKSAVYVDLADMPYFGFAKEETYLQSDAEKWLEDTSMTFDIILSASTIQWFANPIHFISTVKRHLNPGGFAILSTFVKGNLHELDALRPSPIIYRSADDYAMASDEIVAEWKRTLRFQSYMDLLRHLRLTGVSPVSRKSVESGKDKKDGHSLVKNDRQPLQLTFRPLVLFVKSDD